MSFLPEAARRILNEGALCYLAAPSTAGPHVTPVVFVLDGGRVWGTTGRGTTKTKLWRREPVAGGLVGFEGRWLSFRGPVTLYDALDPATWPASLRRGPRVASASVRFAMKNARFFAGYARDVTRVPLAWSPPGRVVFSIDVASGAILDGEDVRERWGRWGEGVSGLKTFRRASPGLSADRLPDEVRPLLDEPGEGIVAVPSPQGPVVLPARWSGSGGSFFARLRAPFLALAGIESHGNAAMVVDRASAWRAAKMRGVLLRGPTSVYVSSEVRSGRSELRALVDEFSADAAVIRILPRTAVWWSGWASGTVRPA
ncbi:MAG: hypothetical protein ACRDHM_10960 [Actinomycetota bacterium]